MDDYTKVHYPQQLFYSPFEFPPSIAFSHNSITGQTTIIAAQMQVGQSSSNGGEDSIATRWSIAPTNSQAPNRHHSISTQEVRYSDGESLNPDEEGEYRQPSARRQSLSMMTWNGAGTTAGSGYPPLHQSQHNPSTASGYPVPSTSYHPTTQTQTQQVILSPTYHFSNGALPTLRAAETNHPVLSSKFSWSPVEITDSRVAGHGGNWNNAIGPVDGRAMVPAGNVFHSGIGPQRSSTFPQLLPPEPHTWNQPPAWLNSGIPPPQQLLQPPLLSYPSSSSIHPSRSFENHQLVRTTHDAPYTRANVHMVGSPVIRLSRPTHSIRHRNFTGSIPLATKRKPLPKIYSCESCSKKFDRPSTLKVHEAIHTGAKDHLCEYCIRAFTVQSNMKRHMRVCKHKPLTPPLNLCYYSFAAPALTIGLTIISSAAMDRIDRTNGLLLDGHSSSSAITSNASVGADGPYAGQASGSNLPNFASMIPFDNVVDSPHGPAVVRGFKAPMIIAAMFSVQQKVPNSISKLTLVQLECAVPLAPVRPHPKYAALYANTHINGHASAAGNEARTNTVVETNLNSKVARLLRPASIEEVLDTDTQRGVPFNLLSSTEAAISDTDRLSGVASPSNNTGGGVVGDPALTSGVTGEGVESIDRSIRAQGLLALPNDLYEERNSYYPRSRYCYHPAEFDRINILPGPGTMDLPPEEEPIQ